MDRGHLRAEDCVLLLLHLLGVGDLLLLRGADDALCFLFVADADRGDEGADTDSRRTQAVDLIDLQAGVDLSAGIKNLIRLIRRDGVEAASEGIQLDEIQIIPGVDKIRRRVKTRVVHPLVVDAERPLQFAEMGDGVLGQHRHPVGIDHLRDSVVDLRVDMIGSSGENDAVASGLFQIAERLFALPFDVPACLRLLLPRGHCRVDHLDLRKVMENLHHAVAEDLLIGEGEEGIHETD